MPRNGGRVVGSANLPPPGGRSDTLQVSIVHASSLGREDIPAGARYRASVSLSLEFFR
jgi:hypothetical protein